jgi:putative membrane protein
MVNQYQDEKSQNVYTLIDKGRSMQMPFEGLSLLDYAINTSLALTNIILRKQDKAGVFTFSKKVEDRVVADRKSSQMERIMEALYSIKTNFQETDFSRLYSDINNTIKQRSLLLLYTNFETRNSLYRQLPFLKAIAKKHLLVVIFFQNTELERMVQKPSENIQEVYDKVIAEKFSFEKRLIVQELIRHGIQCILTAPQELTLQSINKYLELKARGMI